MEAARSSERWLSYLITTRCDNPKDLDLNLHLHENLKSREVQEVKTYKCTNA